MSHQMTYADSHNATSSPVSECGHLPCAEQDGRITNRYGQEVAHASLSARQAKEMGLLTSGTFGLHSSTSSASANLALSLVNRLQAKTASDGSTLFRLTWKQRTTPSARSIYALRASVRRISDSDCSGWATPTTREWKECGDVSQSFFRKDGKMRNDTLYRQLWLHMFGMDGRPSREQIKALECCHLTLARELMMLPVGWGNSAPTEMPSSRRSRKSS